MNKIIVMFLLCCMLGLPLAIYAEGETGGSNPGKGRKTRVIERISKTVSDIRAIAGSFRQERRLAMLREPVVSTGRFYCEKPDKLRWELISPEPFGFLVNGSSAKQWKGNEGPSEAFDAKQNPVIRLIVEQIFAWTSADFKWIEQRYGITVLKDDPIALKLSPREPGEKRYIDHIRVSFEPDTNYVHTVDILEKGDDSTRIIFSNMVINGQLQKGLFD
jgi:outer membrane lipoprotein-sorting protein